MYFYMYLMNTLLHTKYLWWNNFDFDSMYLYKPDKSNGVKSDGYIKHWCSFPKLFYIFLKHIVEQNTHKKHKRYWLQTSLEFQLFTKTCVPHLETCLSAKLNILFYYTTYCPLKQKEYLYHFLGNIFIFLTS